MENMENSLEEQMRYDRARKKVRAIKGFYMHLFAYIGVNAFIIVNSWIKLGPGGDYFNFNIFATAIFWGFGLLIHALGVFGRSILLGENWEERKIRAIMEEDERKSKNWK